MAKNLTFKPFGADSGSSWADEDDDVEPLVIAPPQVPAVAEKAQPEQEEPERRDYDRTGNDLPSANANATMGLLCADGRHHGAPRGNHDRHYDDRRGGHDRHYDDRRGGYDRHYDDHRGGHRERDNYRSHRGGDHAERPREHVERVKNPVPDHPPYKIFVGNLPFRMHEDDLADFLGHEGIRDIRFPKEFDTNRSKGFAYVEFDDRESLVRALELDGHDADGRAVKIDVAAERNSRADKSSGFFTKRRNNDAAHEEATAPKERPRLTLLPRNTATTEKSDGPKKPSIFGDAKPRDENAYLERRKSKELERKKSVDDVKTPKVEGEKKKQGPPSRKNSHDDGFGLARGGRGVRSERGRGERSGGRGEHHAGGRGGRGQTPATTTPKKEKPTEAAAPAARKSEPRQKRTEPVKAKIAAPAKITNTFSALDLDSDSD